MTDFYAATVSEVRPQPNGRDAYIATIPIAVEGLGVLMDEGSVWFEEARGKYRVGDTVHASAVYQTGTGAPFLIPKLTYVAQLPPGATAFVRLRLRSG